MAEEVAATRNRRLILVAATVLGLVLLCLCLALLFFFRPRSAARPLKPIQPEPAPVALALESQPVTVTFSELNDDPFSFRDRRIRVTGNYTPLPPPECIPQSGPGATWALIADNLQLDAIGFERVLRLVPPGATLTAEGIWRHYNGPLGCGKGAPAGVAWYLETEQIVEPNPLVVQGPRGVMPAGAAVPGTVLTPDADITVTVSPDTLTPTLATATPTLVLTPTATIPITPTPAITTPVGTMPAQTVTPTVTVATPATPAVTATPQPGVTPTATVGAIQTPPQEATPPPLVTATPGPYPGPGTAVPTLTPRTYP